MAVRKKVTTARPSAPGSIRESTPGNVLKTNDNFDVRMYRGQPWAKKITRGYIREYLPEAGPRGQGRVNFLYNPNTISYDFQINGSLIAPDQLHPVATPGMIGGNGLQFSLLFSRQFEVAYRGDTMGVHRDIDALKYITGITDFKAGYMIQKTNMFVMGAHPSMVFYGFIDSMSIDVGYFSEQMVPMFAQVSIHATYVPPMDKNNLHTDETTYKPPDPAAVAAVSDAVNTAGTGNRSPVVPTGPSVGDIDPMLLYLPKSNADLSALAGGP